VIVSAMGGKANSTIQTESGDARSAIYVKIAEEEKRVAALQRQRDIYQSMIDRGIIKGHRDIQGNIIQPDFEQLARDGTIGAHNPDEGVPWYFLVSVLAAVLAVFAISGGLVGTFCVGKQQEARGPRIFRYQ
jgi:hypothetical protein